MTSQLTILIFCNHLLSYSATFVRSQAEALEDFRPYYVGCRKLRKSLSLPAQQEITLGKESVLGKMLEFLYKFTGLAPRFKEKLRELEPCLIHAHFGVGGVLALPLIDFLNIPLIVTFHGFEATVKEEYVKNSFFSHKLYHRKKHILAQKAQSIIAVSGFIKNKLLEQGFAEEKIVVHYIGIDLKKFSPNPDVERRPIVLFVGRLVEKKGCWYLLKAMAKVQESDKNVEVVVIGDGSLRKELEDFAKTNLKNFQFLGVQSPERVKFWMNKSRIFCVPSIVAENGDAEAFGIVFAEAQAMKLPIVSFDTGGISEAVLHNETGFLCPEHDWNTLSEKISLLLSDQSLWHRMSESGRLRVEKFFDLEKQTRKLEDIYHKAIDVHY